MFRFLSVFLACAVSSILVALSWSADVAAQASCTQITDVQGLQAIQNNLSGNYCLANDIDASATAGWNSGAGFTPLGNFTGVLDGQNHTIDKLTINVGNVPGADVGLFGLIGSGGAVDNLGLTNFVFTTAGQNSRIGALAAGNLGTITQASATGSVSTTTTGVIFGGLVASNFDGGTITKSSANVQFTGASSDRVGGLVGENFAVISQSYAIGGVSGEDYVGGLVGVNFPTGSITQSYAIGTAGGALDIGGLVGLNQGAITQSYATGTTNPSGNAGVAIGGLVGVNSGSVSQSYATGSLESGADLA
jgi:hypothetical protein